MPEQRSEIEPQQLHPSGLSGILGEELGNQYLRTPKTSPEQIYVIHEHTLNGRNPK